MAIFANSAGCIFGKEPIANHLLEPFVASPSIKTATRRTIVMIRKGSANLENFL